MGNVKYEISCDEVLGVVGIYDFDKKIRFDICRFVSIKSEMII